MADVTIKCPLCSQLLTVETEWAGMEVECPLCHGKITVPYFQPRSTPPPPPSPVMPSRMGSMPRQAPVNQYYRAGFCNAAPDIELYSPLGIGIVGFFFTPLVAEWLIFKNWKALEEDKEVKKSVIGYIVMIIAMFLLYIFFKLLGLLIIYLLWLYGNVFSLSRYLKKNEITYQKRSIKTFIFIYLGILALYAVVLWVCLGT